MPKKPNRREQQIRDRILSCLEQHAAEGWWIPWRDVVRVTRVYDLSPSVSIRALSALIREGKIDFLDLAVRGETPNILIRLRKSKRRRG